MAIPVAGCGHLAGVLGSWRHKSVGPPAPVHELSMTGEGGVAASFPQYWKRNTLLVDLSSASGSGGIVLEPRDGAAWPARLAFRVTPGSIGVLEVRGAQRIVLPIVTQAGAPIDLGLVASVYRPNTAKITVSWSPR